MCGIVGIWNKNYKTSLKWALVAAGGIQHRGQNGTGICLKTKDKIIKYASDGLLKEAFGSKSRESLNQKCRWIIVHCRYGTNGDYDERNLQPCITKSKEGIEICVVHNGEFVNLKKPDKYISDTPVFTKILSEAKGKNWDEKILNTLKKVSGAYSLIIGIKNNLYLARDNFGLKPLILGKVKDGWIAASESHSLDKIGVETIRQIKRGEVIKINLKGISIIKEGAGTKGNFCDFEWAYFCRPDSILPTKENLDDENSPDKWISISRFRERCGEMIARRNPIKSDFVIGVPDSGVAVAVGYAKELKLPYRQAVIRDHFDANGDKRLFLGDAEMKKIGNKVLGKLCLIPDKKIWNDAVVVVGDDSLVRGNVSKKLTNAIFKLGAKEVHWIIGFPPVRHTCHLGVSIRSERELIAARYQGDTKKIAQEIGATSVNYIDHKDFIRARHLKKKMKVCSELKEIYLKNGGCGGCITGQYPVDKDGMVHPCCINRFNLLD